MENRRLLKPADHKGPAAPIRALLSSPALYRALRYLSRPILGFLLSRATVLDGLAPFGVGLVSAAGGGAEGLLTLGGALLGYLLGWGELDSVKYIAIMVLAFSGGFVFRKSRLSGNPFFMPLLTAVAALFVGLVILIGDGVGITSVLLLLTDIVLMGGTSYFFRLALDGGAGESAMRKSFGVLMLAASVFISLSGWVIFGELQPARFAASLFVLLSAYRGGAGVGSASGLAIGVTMDLAAGSPFLSVSYGISGFLAGIVRPRGKLLSAVIYIVSGGVVALWAPTGQMRSAVLIEAFVASVAFLLIPGRTSARAVETFEEELPAADDMAKRSRTFVRKRLEHTSSAFRELYRSLQSTFEGTAKKNDNDIYTVFDQTAEKICRRCAMRGVCWDRDASMTRQALSDASSKLSAKGRADSSDFPAHFSSRCVQFGKFLSSVNEELTALLLRRQYRSRLDESRSHICRQYSEMSRILENVASDVGQDIAFDRKAEQHLQRYLDGTRLSLRGSVYGDSAGRRWVEIEGDESERLLEQEHMLRRIGMCVGFPVSQPEFIMNPYGAKLVFGEAECFTATLGIASHKKKGEEISGDSGTYFKTPDGKLFVLLSDGMGSGKEAAVGSSQAVRLLERFLRAGIQPEVALETLNSSLILKGEGGFVTVDLLICDLLSGETRFYKNGASPTYVKKGRKVKRISGKALPSGVEVCGSGTPDMTSIGLASDDVCIMVSDGVTGLDGDEWLVAALRVCEPESPKELASEVLRQAVLRQGAADDMTVIVLKIHRRNDAELE